MRDNSVARHTKEHERAAITIRDTSSNGVTQTEHERNIVTIRDGIIPGNPNVGGGCACLDYSQGS
jgi:hypothetical protein